MNITAAQRTIVSCKITTTEKTDIPLRTAFQGYHSAFRSDANSNIRRLTFCEVRDLSGTTHQRSTCSECKKAM